MNKPRPVLFYPNLRQVKLRNLHKDRLVFWAWTRAGVGSPKVFRILNPGEEAVVQMSEFRKAVWVRDGMTGKITGYNAPKPQGRRKRNVQITDSTHGHVRNTPTDGVPISTTPTEGRRVNEAGSI